jgi:hypothetical protein
LTERIRRSSRLFASASRLASVELLWHDDGRVYSSMLGGVAVIEDSTVGRFAFTEKLMFRKINGGATIVTVVLQCPYDSVTLLSTANFTRRLPKTKTHGLQFLPIVY